MRILIGILLIAGFFALAVILSLSYEWLRRKLNKPRIGFEHYLIKLLQRDDYVSIDGKIMRYSHIASTGEAIDIHRPPHYTNQLAGGELAFDDGTPLTYKYYYPSALLKCDFIYGKYGLKWAKDQETAQQAKKKIKEDNF